MGSEWQKAKLTDHYEIRSGLSKPAKDFGSGYPFLTFKNVFYNYFVPSELTELVQSTEKERAGCSVQRGDVFLTRTSETMNELGMSSVALKNYENSSFNGFCKRLRPKPESDLVPEYVGYYLRSPRFRNDMLAFSTMSTRASLNNDMIGRLDISYPSPDSQRKVAHVLKSFDDKITINRQTNQTLEQMAQTLFKSWFVDFDPVKAKMNGEQPKGMDAPFLSKEVASLFPEKLVESELGLIPEGWEASKLEDLVDIASSKRVFAKEYLEEGVPFYRGKEITELSKGNSVTPEIYISEERYQELKDKAGAPKEGNILITSVGTIGNTYLVDSDDKFYFKDGNLTWVRDYKDEEIPYFLMEWFKSVVGKCAIENIKIGSTQQAITIKSLNGIKLVNPSNDIHKNFTKLIEPLYRKHRANIKQSKALANLRDTLLPKLLSGEIDLENLQVEQAKALAE